MSICKNHGAPISYTEKDCPACVQLAQYQKEKHCKFCPFPKGIRPGTCEYINCEHLKPELANKTKVTVKQLQAELAECLGERDGARMTVERLQADLARRNRMVDLLGNSFGCIQGCSQWKNSACINFTGQECFNHKMSYFYAKASAEGKDGD